MTRREQELEHNISYWLDSSRKMEGFMVLVMALIKELRELRELRSRTE